MFIAPMLTNCTCQISPARLEKICGLALLNFIYFKCQKALRIITCCEEAMQGCLLYYMITVSPVPGKYYIIFP